MTKDPKLLYTTFLNEEKTEAWLTEGRCGNARKMKKQTDTSSV